MFLVHEGIKRKEKTLVFTRNLDTIEYFKMKLDEAGINSAVIRGDVKTSVGGAYSGGGSSTASIYTTHPVLKSRQGIVEQFASDKEVSVFLISTRVCCEVRVSTSRSGVLISGVFRLEG